LRVPERDINSMLQQWVQEALALHRLGRLAEAESLYLKALSADRNFYPALHLTGLLLIQAGRAAEALTFIERALTLQPGRPESLANYGVALEGVGRCEEALKVLQEVVHLLPEDARGWSNQGALLAKLHRNGEALADFDRAVALDPVNEGAWINRGLILMVLGRPEEALQSFDTALERRPDQVEVRNNRGLALKAMGRTSAALAEFNRVLQEKPDHPGALVNRASVLRTTGEVDQALQSYHRALAIQPNMPEALASRASCLWAHKSDLAGAIIDLERLMAVKPDYPYAQGDLLHMQMHAGDWRGLAHKRIALDEGVRAGKRVVEPYVYQGLSSSPADLLESAKIYTRDKYPPVPFTQRYQGAEGKIRLGYLCGEFRAQATMYLAAGLFEHHDRTRFEVTGFDNSRDDGSAMRKRVIVAFDRFVPIQTLSDREAANLIAGEGIDILVNLNGYFGALRMGVFARRPAPLQVNYLGFPGSLGADYIDYILADAEVIPRGEEQFYSEQVVRLAGSYQINDGARLVPAPAERAAHGLKETDFVFCHFNYSYKITPEIFALWLRLLKNAPLSVLWLLESNALFAGTLRREIARAHIDPARLVLAPPMEHAAHISRLALGDLFLDSLPCNAHTTASDALWVGLPVITCRGASFAGRVAASLLSAVGLPELITNGLDEYESLALELTKDRTRLQCYRDRLDHRANPLPLFDTVRTTRQIESAYTQMQARRTEGLMPTSFDVRA
jgi:protein O-GlcNAc transferase